MRTGMLVFGMTASGILGGVVGALLAGASGTGAKEPGTVATATSSVEPSAASPSSRDRDGGEIRDRLAALEGNLAASAAETTRLREALEAERKASASLREKVEAGGSGAGQFGGPGRLPFGGSPLEGEAGAALQSLSLALPERLRKSGELRRLPEEERWAKARSALGLTGYQEEELKAAIRERNEAMKEATKIVASESTSEDGSASHSVTIAMPDVGKMGEARKKYDDRVSQALNADQKKGWREEGYEGALGGGGGASFGFVTGDVEVIAGPEDGGK
jgi:hypothetical protein